MTTLTIRVDEKLKKDAAALFESLGMNLSVALNMFMRQAVAKQKFPCELELENTKDYKWTYPPGFFDLFGAWKDMGFPDEIEDYLPTEKDDVIL